MYHYGSYESAFLKRMRKQARRKSPIDGAIRNSLNVLSLLRSNIYLPTYSNGLKEVGASLGCTWADAGATGNPEHHMEKEVGTDARRRLETPSGPVQSGRLRRLADSDGIRLPNRGDGRHGRPGAQVTARPAVAWAHDMPAAVKSSRVGWASVSVSRISNTSISVPISITSGRRCSFEPNPEVPQDHRRSGKHSGRRRLKGNRRIAIRAARCPFCRGSELKRFECQTKVKLAFDLGVTRTGVARRVVECAAAAHQMSTMWQTIFLPQRYKRRDKHFHALKSWAMYQHIVHRVSFQGLRRCLRSASA